MKTFPSVNVYCYEHFLFELCEELFVQKSGKFKSTIYFILNGINKIEDKYLSLFSLLNEREISAEAIKAQADEKNSGHLLNCSRGGNSRCSSRHS